ncbi:tripartite tricarboxylate transporter TctB family protein [Pseudoclavibacter sp. RFBJ3]|uniref:tripartite tricarboxylate transporter TctB family protein n=1 Tax=unclassified Pseudoclavibacter TaxID=2615177 RepID=UPI000CE85BD9|nr:MULTISPECIES: tripartite tricarboxylate transporter TctB family protein [unclassified Pseudoclavibacter]PPF83071.1 tripartite tricarboxylate transporter TctB family protein [Pseudoclavibacter sp. RFBJ5]PPF91770.1 tripartite tricarboxylate transporter TctB family protein [Pseudoclavibacter sp. RFBJ3]PPF96707.1 tripartite tricarboxylate transporter TctB family protein [Pseudoclavibacter sp. RFBH5]PPG19630.1 tripartite tricarboxylate transporter TctB family protein [Pseudoclavibacter sp. RFBI4]
MTHHANPTAASAVIGGDLTFAAGPSKTATLLKGLTMPLVIAAFATYLLSGIFTMKVPEGADFPGPQFFPGLIAAGLYLFAALLAVGAVRELRATAASSSTMTEEELLARALADDEALAAAGSADAPRKVRVDVKSFAWVVGSFLVFSLTLDLLGWVIAAALLFWCVARGFGSTKPVASLVVGFTLSSLAYIAFDMALGMSLPSGILGGI